MFYRAGMAHFPPYDGVEHFAPVEPYFPLKKVRFHTIPKLPKPPTAKELRKDGMVLSTYTTALLDMRMINRD